MKTTNKYYFQARLTRYQVEAPNVELACLVMVNYFEEPMQIILLNDDPEKESIIYCPDEETKDHLVDMDHRQYMEEHHLEYEVAKTTIRRIQIGEKAPRKKTKKNDKSDSWFIDA